MTVETKVQSSKDWGVLASQDLENVSGLGAYKQKPEFLEISALLREHLGAPTGALTIHGSVVGALAWPGVGEEAQKKAIASGAAVFECSGMTYLHVRGRDAERFLEVLMPRNVRSVKAKQAFFALFTTPEGTVDDEAVVLRLSDTEFILSCGGCKELSFIDEAYRQYPDVEVYESTQLSFNIKGPSHVQAMSRLFLDDDRDRLAQIKALRFCELNTRGGHPVRVVKSKIGIELWGNCEAIAWAWGEMLKEPQYFTPCGWDILHSYRVDCENIIFALYPLDINRRTSFWDSGHAWMMKEKKQDFVGRRILEQSQNTEARRLVKITQRQGESFALPRAETCLRTRDGCLAGHITSAAISLVHDRPRAFALLQPGVEEYQCLSDDDTGASWSID